MNKEKIKATLRSNFKWFIKSGVMIPSDGQWGVAERLLLTNNGDNGNSGIEKALKDFPAWTFSHEICVLEQRRSDCNFQTAYYFLLLDSLFNDGQGTALADKLLNYLYNLSGMLSYQEKIASFPPGIWNWSNIRWTPAVWFDDNSWCIMIALLIARRNPEFDKKYRMKEYASLGAINLSNAFESNYFNDSKDTEKFFWRGDLKLPHWGALVMAALAMAGDEHPEQASRWKTWAETYFTEVVGRLDELNPSEWSYALLGLAIAARVYDDVDSSTFTALGDQIADLLVRQMEHETGCLPSAHFEAPLGIHLVDFIYTQNWAILALQSFNAIRFTPEREEILAKMLKFVLEIQDNTPKQELHGCWRGMYDLSKNCWGGGDRYEGGASSIYTGWTNAPLGWSLVFQHEKTSLVEELLRKV